VIDCEDSCRICSTLPRFLPEARQRFRERFRPPNCECGPAAASAPRPAGEPPPCPADEPLLRRAWEVRLYHLHDLPVKLRLLPWRLASSNVARNSRVDLFKDSFGPTLHFFAVRVQHIFQLRLQSGQRLLPARSRFGPNVVRAAGSSPRHASGPTPSRCVLLLQRIPQRCYSLLCLGYSTRRRFAGWPWRDAPSRPATESSTRARARSNPPAARSCASASVFSTAARHRACTDSNSLASCPCENDWRGRERGCHLLLNLIGRSPQRLELCSCRFFPLLRGFLVRPRGLISARVTICASDCSDWSSTGPPFPPPPGILFAESRPYLPVAGRARCAGLRLLARALPFKSRVSCCSCGASQRGNSVRSASAAAAWAVLDAHPPRTETCRSRAPSHWRFPRVLRQTFAPIVRMTAAAPPKPLAKPLPARSLESAVWLPPPAALPAAPTCNDASVVLVGEGNPLKLSAPAAGGISASPKCNAGSVSPPPLEAMAVSRVAHPTSSRLASSQGCGPVFRRKRDAPDVAGDFQLQRHLKKAAAPFEGR